MSEEGHKSRIAEIPDSLRLSDAAEGLSGRIDCSPENIEQGLAKLVLSLIELLRQLLERQAIRRMEGGALTDEQIEQMGEDRKSTRLNSSHVRISYAVFCLKKKIP